MILLSAALGAAFFSSLTAPLFEHLYEGELFSFDPKEELFFHLGKPYAILRGESCHHASIPYASLSSHPLAREVILLNPDSPYLDKCYCTFKEGLEEASHAEILTKLVAYVASLFSHADVDPFVDRICRPQDYTATRHAILLPVLPLDTFVRFGIGVCRHRALLVSYLADRLIQDGLLPEGCCHHVRSPLRKQLNHAWNLFVSRDLCFHLDATWHNIYELKGDWKRTLTSLYGEAAVAKIETLLF